MQKERYVTPISSEAVDQIRAERQSVHPAIYEFARDLTSEVNYEFLRVYGPLLDERPQRRNNNVFERLVIGDDIGNDFNAWNGLQEKRNAQVLGDELDGHTGPDHGVMYLMDPITSWERLPINLQGFYIEMYGDSAVEHYINAYFAQTIMHELTHLYQPRKLPWATAEMAARFVESELTDFLETGFIRTNIDQLFVSGYEALIAEYGREDVLRHSFGTLQNFPLSHQIDREAREYLNYFR